MCCMAVMNLDAWGDVGAIVPTEQSFRDLRIVYVACLVVVVCPSAGEEAHLSPHTITMMQRMKIHAVR